MKPGDETTSSGISVDAIDALGVMRTLPHRYPMLLVDKVENIILGETATGIKNVTINEPFFQGHFPSQPVMPGVLIIESMAQTAAILVAKTLGRESVGKLVYFMSIDGARFRHPVVPGDTLHIKVTKERHRGLVWKFKCEAKVGDKLCAEATVTAMMVDPEEDAGKDGS